MIEWSARPILEGAYSVVTARIYWPPQTVYRLQKVVDRLENEQEMRAYLLAVCEAMQVEIMDALIDRYFSEIGVSDE